MRFGEETMKKGQSRRDIHDFILLLLSLIVCVAVFFGFIIYWIHPLHTETREITMRRKSMEEQKFGLEEKVRVRTLNLQDLKENKGHKLEDGYRIMYKFIKDDEDLIILDNTIDPNLPIRSNYPQAPTIGE